MKLPNDLNLKQTGKIEKLALVAYFLAAASILLLFYQLEPPPTDILMGLSISATILYFLIARKLPALDLPSKLIVAFLVLNLLQLYFYQTPQAYFWVAVTTFLIFGFLTLKFLAYRFSIRYLFNTYIVSTAISVGFMIYPFISLYSYGIVSDWIHLGRSRGLFKDPNVAGPFLIPALIYFIDDFLQKPKLWKLIFSCLLTVGIFFSLSRGALIATGVAVLVFLILRRREILANWNKLALVLFFQAITLLIIFSYGPFKELASQRFRLVQGYDTTSRSVSWDSGITGFVENPSGSGPGSFESGVVKSQRSIVQRTIENSALTEQKKSELIKELDTRGIVSVGQSVGLYITPSAHDTYLRVLRENGVIGITLFLGFILSILWACREMVLKGQSLSSINIALLASWIGVLANSFVIDTLHWRLLWYLPALLLASLALKRAKN